MLKGLSAALAVVAALAGAACSQTPSHAAAVPAAAPAAQIAPWGLDLGARDAAVKPGDDFYRYAEGHWLDSQQIPADRSRWGSFEELSERSHEQVRAIVEALPAGAPAGSVAQKVGDYYRSYLDTATIERLGLAPAQAGLDAIAAARSYADVATLMGRPDLGLRSPLRLGIAPDQKNPDRYMVILTQSGLGLPDRDYYLKDDAVYSKLRAQYVEHITRLLSLSGTTDAATQAHAILELETHIARLHWPAAKRRERDLTYNPRSTRGARAAGARLPLAGAARRRRPRGAAALRGARDWTRCRRWRSSSPRCRSTPGAPTCATTTWSRTATCCRRPSTTSASTSTATPCTASRSSASAGSARVTRVDADLGEAVGELYVAALLPAELQAAGARPGREPARRLRRAHQAAAVDERRPPRRWRCRSWRRSIPRSAIPTSGATTRSLSVVHGDAFGNAVRARVFDWQRQVRRLGQPTDRDEWGMTPQTINAYYNPTFNEVVFPAAILQPPFFDPHADPAVNYGGIGAVIGHEMGHGFDDQGSKSDARGVLRTWWQPGDTDAFKKRVDSLAAQYDGFTVLPGLNVNGRLTLGENIGDLGGLSVALDAYHRSPAAAPPRRCATGSRATSASSSPMRRSGARSTATSSCARRCCPTRTARRSSASTAWCATSTPGTRPSTSGPATSCT